MGFNGNALHEHSPVSQWLAGDGLGGVILFDKDLESGSYGKNLANQAQIRDLINQLHYYASKNSTNSETIPLLTAIDYEGGVVDRLSKIEGCMSTLKPVELARLSLKDFEEEVSQMALTLKALGFNLNFAPVVDLKLNELQGIIGKLGRSFSKNPEIVANLAKQFVEIFSRYGIACAYKHFPGHGSAVGDTHEGFVDVSDTFQEEELMPYQTLVKDPYHPVMIMTAHVVNKHLDSSGLPATLSHDILSGILREEMGYDGVIVSDDLQMNAIASHYSLEDALCLTINAGADMIIFGNQLGNNSAPEVIDIVERLVLQNKIDSQRIDQAFRRIIRLKKQLNCKELINID